MMRFMPVRYVLLIVLVQSVVFLSGACTFDSTHLDSLKCAPNGIESDGRVCRDGYWVASDGLDAVIDDAVTDDTVIDDVIIVDVADDVAADADVDPCIPLEDSVLCEELGKDCGAVETMDNCDLPRTLACGDCTAEEICHDDNRCACAGQSITELCLAEGVECGEITSIDACDQERTVQCDPCSGANQICVDNHCCEGETDEELCDTAEEIECGVTEFTDQCGAEREVDCGGCEGEGAWQPSGAAFACCSENGEDTCTCQLENFIVPDCQDNTCTARVDEMRTVRSDCAGCAGLDCPEWDACDYASTCAESATRIRTCNRNACEEGACIVSETVNESEPCDRETDGDTCTDGIDACFTGTCSGGACEPGPACSGSDTECGCNVCEDCTALSGPFQFGAWAGCCVDGQACECKSVENRVYRCDGTICTFDAEPMAPATRNCMTCLADHCDDPPTDLSACVYESTCAVTGDLPYNCYSYSCDGGTCVQTITGETVENAELCDDGTVGSECDLGGGSSCQGQCNDSGQCIEPTCEGTTTSCGTCGECFDCSAEDTWEPVGEEYYCCDGDSLCRCQDRLTTTHVCNEGSCGALDPITVRHIKTDTCDACTSTGNAGCKEFADEACCVTNKNTSQGC